MTDFITKNPTKHHKTPTRMQPGRAAYHKTYEMLSRVMWNEEVTANASALKQNHPGFVIFTHESGLLISSHKSINFSLVKMEE